MEHRVWEQLLFEGHARFREKEIIQKKDYNWQGRQDSYEEDPKRVKKRLDRTGSRDDPNSMFNFGGEKWPDAKGYVIALDIYRNLLDRNNLDTEEPLAASKDWLKKQIKLSLDKLYRV